MIVELGHFALILALFVAVVQVVLPLAGAHVGNVTWMEAARPTAFLQFILVAISFGALTYAHVTDDFSVVNVVANSHSLKPMLYKVSGVWGNHEGSLLLWVLILAAYGSAVALFGGNLPPALRARVLGVQALVAVGFYLFMLYTSNPFERIVPAPADGRDLNPLLQDPGLAFHPPFLYLGYVGFSVAFSFAIAALIEGRVDAAWARWVRPWTLAAWAFLSIGIGLGSWWAYYELGWGGWWFWDPVENASFMPWLAGTALLHSAVVVEKRNTLKGWTIFLAIITFSLSLLGAFIVRSGVLTSVHAFASDPERGVFLLLLLVAVTGGSFFLYALRAPQLKSGGLFQPVSREGALLLNNLLMATAAAVVLLGTLYPLFLDALDLGKISVGPPFFNIVFIPLMIPMIIAMGVGPMMAWKRGDLVHALKRLRVAFIITFVAVLASWAMWTGGSFTMALGFGLAAWLVTGALVEFSERIRLFRVPLSQSLGRAIGLPRSAWGLTLAHTGLGIAVAGMVGASGLQQESIQVMRFGDSVTVGGYTYTLEGVESGKGPNYFYDRATFRVDRDGAPVTVLYPENRKYPVQGRPTTEAAIYPTFLADLYAVIGDPDEATGGYVTRIYHNPLVGWLWFGFSLMVVGGFVSLTDRRHRVGAPAKTKIKAAARPQPAE